MVIRRHSRKALWVARDLLGLARHRRGSTTLEFAVIGLAFFGLVLFVIALGFRLYVQVALEYACSRTARLLAVDSTQSRSASAQKFQSATFCPLLDAFLACNVTISLQPVTDFRNGSTTGGTGTPPFSPGQGGSLMLLRVTYQLPALSWPVPTRGGATGAFGATTVTVGYPYQNEY